MKLHSFALAVATAFATFAQAAHVRTPAETLFRPLQRGPMSLTRAGSGSAKQFAGLTAIASGLASATVSTAVVNSDSIIFIGTQVASLNTASGGVAINLVVQSVVSNVSFAIATHDGQGRPGTTTAMWEIRR